jgi:hypothetical protein
VYDGERVLDAVLDGVRERVEVCDGVLVLERVRVDVFERVPDELDDPVGVREGGARRVKVAVVDGVLDRVDEDVALLVGVCAADVVLVAVCCGW